MGVTDVRHLKQLKDENKRLDTLAADPTIDKYMLQETTANKQ
jgi:hypothetical protein